MILQPYSDGHQRALIHRRFRMWPVKNAPLTEQADQHTRTFALLDTCTQFDEQSFDIGPTDIRRCWPREDLLQSTLVFAPHKIMVAESGIKLCYHIVRPTIPSEISSSRAACVRTAIRPCAASRLRGLPIPPAWTAQTAPASRRWRRRCGWRSARTASVACGWRPSGWPRRPFRPARCGRH